MEPIKDKDVGVLWAEHYPNRSDNVLSTTMVLVLCFIVKERASHGYPMGTGRIKSTTLWPTSAFRKINFTRSKASCTEWAVV